MKNPLTQQSLRKPLIDNEIVRIEMPKEDSFMKFHDGQYQFEVPFIMYADFEAILKPIEINN